MLDIREKGDQGLSKMAILVERKSSANASNPEDTLKVAPDEEVEAISRKLMKRNQAAYKVLAK